MSTDEACMLEALAEARKGEGGTRPNPPVGAVLAVDGRIVARGHHRRAGGPHAEVDCLSRAGAAAKGGTLYVTLEPCSTQGRVGPCTEAILAAGVKRVVCAATDENPKHAGRGFAVLRKAGVEVVEGVCRAEAEALLAPFFKHVRTGLPFLTLKMAQSLDGAIADHAGVSRWVTGPESRAAVADLRSRADVVLVGVGTVLADNPSLLRKNESCFSPQRTQRTQSFSGASRSDPETDERMRVPPEKESLRSLCSFVANQTDGEGEGLPGLRCVLDATGRTPLSAQLFTDGHAAQTIVATTERCPAETRRAYEETGAAVWVLPTAFPAGTQADHPAIDLRALLRRFGEEGILHVLCEGGAALASSFVNEGLVDELLLFIAPKILGAPSTRTFGAYPFDLPSCPSFDIRSVDRFGPDVCLRLTPKA